MLKIKRNRVFTLGVFAALPLLAFAAAACPGGNDRITGETEGSSEGSFLQRAYDREFEGEEVTIFGPCRDNCADIYNNILSGFNERTGINAVYTGSADFEEVIQTRIRSGNPPDIVDFPQPGLASAFIESGEIINVTDYISRSWLDGQYQPGWVDASVLSDSDGNDFTAGVWSRISTKSLVFYAKDDFEASGYEVPETWEELEALTDQIREDGGTPWCVGIESGGATGWVATDWTEDLLLRTTTPENYDRWTLPAGGDRLAFDSPEVRNAIEIWSDLWFEDGNVSGGREQIVASGVGDVADGLVAEDGAECFMHRQAQWITTGWIDNLGAVAGEDFDVFYLPGFENPAPGVPERPFLIAGDLNSATSDRAAVLAVLEFHATPDSVSGWVSIGGQLTPYAGTQLSDYPNDLDRKVAGLLATADAVRFDGSDLQPGAVGAGSFWDQITEYVAGNQDLDTTVKAIDETWPE